MSRSESLAKADREKLTVLRRALHAEPELGGQEAATAARLRDWLTPCRPQRLLADLGGHGLAAVFAAEADCSGPTVALRAELDATPIESTHGLPHASRRCGVSHACGHDGHMAMLCGVALALGRRPLRRGRLVLLFQPAEETGQGARAVAADPRWQALAVDRIFALHNLPGQVRGRILLREGPFTAASADLVIRLRDRTGHAGDLERGRGPSLALGRLVPALVSLPIDLARQGGLAFVTVGQAQADEPASGASPVRAEIMATLRAERPQALAHLQGLAEALVAAEAARDGLDYRIARRGDFPATLNDAACVASARQAARAARLPVARPPESPFRWSEDFGWFLRGIPGAMIGIGAGAGQPALHAGDFDFPDALLPLGVRFYTALLLELGLLS